MNKIHLLMDQGFISHADIMEYLRDYHRNLHEEESRFPPQLTGDEYEASLLMYDDNEGPEGLGVFPSGDKEPTLDNYMELYPELPEDDL